MDREKVIKGLEILTNRNGCEYIHCDDCCFYISTKPTRCGLREEQIKEDALALLKEQEAVVPLTIDDGVSEIMDKHYKRLKEQEAVEPVLDSFLHKRCPSCGALLNGKFCHECGQAVKWE